MCSVFRTLRLEEALSSRVHAWPIATRSALPLYLDTESAGKVPSIHHTAAMRNHGRPISSEPASDGVAGGGIECISQFLIAAAIEDERILPDSGAYRPTKTDAGQQGEAECKYSEEDLEENADKPG
jgi:hypothetical protein